jgi:predicted ATPase/class 3 adenylate cyclase
MEALHAYIPFDRRQILAKGQTLPDRMQGAALFADISGFTPLTEALARELGPQRGAEELTLHLNRVYDALIAELDRYGGSVVNFSGDAITCWFNRVEDMPADGPALRAVASALAMQKAIGQLASIVIPNGQTISLAMKAAVATGTTRRFQVGDPQIQLVDTLAGSILDQLASAEHQAQKGEVLVDMETVKQLGERLLVSEWREDGAGTQFCVVKGLACDVATAPWPALPEGAIREELARPWLLPAVYERLRKGQGEFVAELRPNVALFLLFTGIDYDDDEQAGTKLDSFVVHVQRTLAHYEASLIQLTIGDKGSYLSAAFGAPLAHEDDPLRALTAALDLRVPPFDYIQDIQIGISRGRMRTGAYGSATCRTYGMMGDDVNLSARLMQAARPGQILVNKTVCQGISEGFSWEELETIRVKGKTEPISVYGLLGKKEQAVVHLQAPRYALPMVGRQEELSQIEQLLEVALNGRGQLIGITGEAGLGKTRLLAEVIHLANERQVTGYGGECQSYGKNISYLVWQGIWRSFFNLDAKGNLEEQVFSLERELSRIDPGLVPRLPLLGAVLNLPIPDNDLTRSFDAKLRKTSLESLLVDCLRARAREGPLIIVLEDAQWLDPLSIDLLQVIGRTIASLPVLLVLAYRQPQVPQEPVLPVTQLANFTELELAEFTNEEAKWLIQLKLNQLSGSQSQASPELVERLTIRAEGNPFYIEELLNYLHDRGHDPNDTRALELLELPASLHSLILSRIDQLTESQKITLKVASVIGRLFRAAMLWGTYPQLGDERSIIGDLDTMTKMDLVALETPDPELTYLFKHIVTQEVAYESLPFGTRAMLHEQIGRYIEGAYARSLDQYVDLLAYHFYRSTDEAKKREYLLRAGEAAQRNYANSAAIDYYQRMLPLVPKKEQVPILLKLGKVLELVGEWAEAGQLYQQILEMAGELGDRQVLAWGQAAQGELLSKQGLYPEAAAWLKGARATFEEMDDQDGVGQTLHSAGSLAARQGDFEPARMLYEQSLEIRRKLGDKRNIGHLLNNLGILARFRGDYKMARSLHEEGLAIRREVGDKWSIANSLNNIGNLALDEDNLAEARARLEEALALLRQVGDRWYTGNALNNLGNVARAQGDYEFARSLYRESMEIVQEFGDKRALAYLLEDIGLLAALQKKPERALSLIGSAGALRLEIGSPLSATEQAKIESILEPVHQTLDEIAQATAIGKGKSMGLEQAIQYALDDLC